MYHEARNQPRKGRDIERRRLLKLRDSLLAIGAAAALTVILTWPIALRFGDAGRLDSGDGRYSIWNVAWVAHAITTNPGSLWNANIFDPHPNALAFSEANLFAGVLAAPVWAATGNPYAASNWTILCAFGLAFVTMFALVRRLTGSVAGALAGACWFAFCPFAFSHIPHIQLLMTFGLPLVLIRLHAFVEAPTLARAGWLGAAMALQGLACGYYGIMGGLIAGFGVLWFSRFEGRWREWRYWVLAILAAVLALAIISPFYGPYSEVRASGFGRTLDDARLHSVRWRSYLASPRIFDQWLLPIIGSWREVLFPGLLPVLFTIFAITRWVRRRTVPVLPTQGVRGFYLAFGALGVWASLGPDGGLYTVLHETLPFFSLLRAPARFGLLVTLMCAVVGASSFVWIERRLQGRARTIVVAGVLLAVVVRSSVGVWPSSRRRRCFAPTSGWRSCRAARWRPSRTGTPAPIVTGTPSTW